MPESLIPKHGGYRKLKSFLVAELVYDVTVRFCDRYIDRRSRTHDQMVQAARSGIQNIAEGSVASGTSKKMELKLTNVAGAPVGLGHDPKSQEDLGHVPRLRDPRRADLIARRPENADAVAMWVRDQHRRQNDGQSGQDGRSMQSTRSISDPVEVVAANAALTLIAVASSLLDRQIAAQAAAFEKEGGFTERLHRIRTARRGT